MRFIVDNGSTSVASTFEEVAHVIAWFLALKEFADGFLEPLRLLASLRAISRSSVVTPIRLRCSISEFIRLLAANSLRTSKFDLRRLQGW